MSDFEKLTDRQKKYYMAGRMVSAESRRILQGSLDTAESEEEKFMLETILFGQSRCI